MSVKLVHESALRDEMWRCQCYLSIHWIFATVFALLEPFRFNGVIVDLAIQTVQMDEFTDKLKEAIAEWTHEGKRALWLNVLTSQSSVIPQITQLGFDFHHAQPGYVCLTKWLPPGTPNNIPGYANHFLGVAGFVVNSHNQLLVIRELYHGQKNSASLWKLPGGLADAGEDLSDTARREVLEETGVDSEFVCVIAYRHMHKYRHECSDIYTVCLMKPLTTEIKSCPVEIAECKWMDLDEYEKLNISDVNRFFVKRYRDIMASGYAIGKKEVLSFDKTCMQNVYSVQKVELAQHSGSNSVNVNDGMGS